MLANVAEWLAHLWQPLDNTRLLGAYNVTFGSEPGALVLQHMMDTIYCTVYEGSDPVQLAYHNGRRSAVEDILRNIDMARYPKKYTLEEKENAS